MTTEFIWILLAMNGNFSVISTSLLYWSSEILILREKIQQVFHILKKAFQHASPLGILSYQSWFINLCVSGVDVHLVKVSGTPEHGKHSSGRPCPSPFPSALLQILFSSRNKGLPLDREETDMTYRQISIYKGKRENPMLGWVVLFWFGMLIRVATRGLLTSGLALFLSPDTEKKKKKRWNFRL